MQPNDRFHQALREKLVELRNQTLVMMVNVRPDTMDEAAFKCREYQTRITTIDEILSHAEAIEKRMYNRELERAFGTGL